MTGAGLSVVEVRGAPATSLETTSRPDEVGGRPGIA
jgi:hypothetical protein